MQNQIMGHNNFFIIRFFTYLIAVLIVAFFLFLINIITRVRIISRDYTLTYQKYDFTSPKIEKPLNNVIAKPNEQKSDSPKISSNSAQTISNQNLIIKEVVVEKNIAKFNGTIYSPKILEDAILNNNPDAPKISNKSLALIKALECEKTDIKERPIDCPPSSTARKIIEEAQAPKYTGQFTKGYSSAELNSKRYAGWRDRCETNSGEKATICIAIGKKPYRIKTPYELCVEKGLGGCTRPPLPDGTQSNALNYGN